MKNFYVRFRLSGKDLIAEHDDIVTGKVVQLTFHDIKYITGDSKVIFMGDTADTAAGSLVSAGIRSNASFDPTNRHLYFPATQVNFNREGENGAYFFNVVGVNPQEWLCVCADNVDKEEID